MKVLVVGPSLNAYGGVAFLLKSLHMQQLFSLNDYLECGGKKLFWKHFADLFLYLKTVRKYELIHLNPSFEFKSILRDLLFAKIALIFNKKVILSWMGWNEAVEDFFLQYKIFKIILLSILNNRLVTNIVSNNNFVTRLNKLGCLNEVDVIFPPYDDYLNNFLFAPKNLDKKKIRLLFLSRIELSKGVDKLIEIYEILNMYDRKYDLTIAGDGKDLIRLKSLSQEKNLHITFTGYVKEDRKIELFKNSDIFIFPSKHAEGVPLILLEAMYAGMVLVVNNVGGISSIMNGNNGFVLNKDISSQEFADIIKSIDAKQFNHISAFNIEYAKKYFKADAIMKKYKIIYEKLKNE